MLVKKYLGLTYKIINFVRKTYSYGYEANNKTKA